jgi:hypothetical protein
MKDLKYMGRALAALAVFGMALPNAALRADAPQKSLPVAAAKKLPKGQLPDVTLAQGGVFSGRVVDHSGTVIEGAEVVLKQGKKEVARTVTDKNGLFSAKDLKGGVYQVSSGNTDGVFRVWTEKTAPPSAKGQALLVMGENGARGQFGAVDPTIVLLTAGVIASVVLNAIILNKVNSLQDQVNDLQSN